MVRRHDLRPGGVPGPGLAAFSAAVFIATRASMFAVFPAAVFGSVLAGADPDMGAEVVELP